MTKIPINKLNLLFNEAQDDCNIHSPDDINDEDDCKCFDTFNYLVETFIDDTENYVVEYDSDCNLVGNKC